MPACLSCRCLQKEVGGPRDVAGSGAGIPDLRPSCPLARPQVCSPQCRSQIKIAVSEELFEKQTCIGVESGPRPLRALPLEHQISPAAPRFTHSLWEALFKRSNAWGLPLRGCWAGSGVERTACLSLGASWFGQDRIRVAGGLKSWAAGVARDRCLTCAPVNEPCLRHPPSTEGLLGAE